MPTWSNPGHDGRVDYAEISGVQGASGEGAGGARQDRGDDRDPTLTSQYGDLPHQRGGAEPLRVEPTVAANLPRRADYPLHGPRREVSLPDVRDYEDSRKESRQTDSAIRQGATGGPLLLFFSPMLPVAESPLRRENHGGTSRRYKGRVQRLIRRAAAATPAPRGADSPTPTRKYGNIRRGASHRLRVRPR